MTMSRDFGFAADRGNDRIGDSAGAAPGSDEGTDRDAAPGDLAVPDAADISGGTSDEERRVASDAGGDPVAAELGAIFAAALADEPESAVTPLSVLHAVRDGRRRRGDSRRRREWAAWKWGGGLAAAAAAVAGVLILGPLIFPQGGATTVAGGSSADLATALASGAEGSAAAQTAGGAASIEAYGTDSGAAGDGGTAADGAAGRSGTQFGVEAAPSAATASESAAAGNAGAASDSSSDIKLGSLQPLTVDEAAALERTFPQGAVLDTAPAPTDLPNPLRGSLVSTPWPGVELEVIVCDWSHGAPPLPPSDARAVSGKGGIAVVASEIGSGNGPHVGAGRLEAIAAAVAATLP